MRKFIILFVVVVALLGVLMIWRSSTFHIVSTAPSIHNVSTVSPYLQIQFSQPLSTDHLKIRTSSSFTRSPEVSGKTLTIPFVVPLASGQNYSITLVSVRSVKGKTIVNKVFRFKPTYIPSSQLPANQQQALLKNESRKGPTFTSIDSLGDYGFDLNQITNIEKEMTLFKPSLRRAVVDSSTITIGTYNPNDPNPRAPILFNVSIDGTDYQASALGDDNSENVVLTLLNPQTSAQVFQGSSAMQ